MKNLLANLVLYDNWLQKYSHYYNSLDKEGKERFVERTLRFMLSKQFRFHKMQRDEKIAFLVSAAAVQITFGLKNYQMSFFNTIHVMKREYLIRGDQSIYYGHVSPKGIHIAWNKFLQGFEDYTDSVNVGLHEMAHAITFDLFLGFTSRQDILLRKRMQSFMESGRSVFRAMKQDTSHVLDDYRADNFDEFWAVSIESFFENPRHLKENLPDLYISLCEVLNQDPLTQRKILDISLA